MTTKFDLLYISPPEKKKKNIYRENPLPQVKNIPPHSFHSLLAGDLKKMILVGMSISPYLHQTFQVPKNWRNPDLYELYVPAPKKALGKIRGITNHPPL